MAGLEPGPLWFQVICDPIKSFDGWLGIYETKPQAKQAADLAKGTSPLIKKSALKQLSAYLQATTT